MQTIALPGVSVFPKMPRISKCFPGLRDMPAAFHGIRAVSGGIAEPASAVAECSRVFRTLATHYRDLAPKMPAPDAGPVQRLLDAFDEA